MGQGTEFKARELLLSLSGQDGRSNSGWLILQNCHLGLDFMFELQSLLSEFQTKGGTNRNFRLFLTTDQSPEQPFPVHLLQMSVKLTSESPRGMKHRLADVYSSLTQHQLKAVEHKDWRPLLFGLAWFHCACIERRKYGPMAWNIPYEFNQSDLAASVDFLQKYLYHLEPNQEIQWDTIRYMVCDCMYGGRVTDEFDRVTLHTLGKRWIAKEILSPDFSFYKNYAIPQCQLPADYLGFFRQLPQFDPPQLFGLSANVEHVFQKNETRKVFGDLYRMQKWQTDTQTETKGAVLQKIIEVLAEWPAAFDASVVGKQLEVLEKQYQEGREHLVKRGSQSNTRSPLNVVLEQEVSIMGEVLEQVRSDLGNLRAALTGAQPLNEHLRIVHVDLQADRVPELWHHGSANLTSLPLWMDLMVKSAQQLREWLLKGQPKVFWMPGFFNPPGFFACIKQLVARTSKQWALDDIEILMTPTKFEAKDVKDDLFDGVHAHGFMLEGAVWDWKRMKLVEAGPKVMEVHPCNTLVTPL
jgi:dynein heavy chain